MDFVNEFPKVMEQAREDLAGNVPGRFSPEDWEKILTEAAARFRSRKATSTDDSTAWQEVVREFVRERYWGYLPNWRPPPSVKPPNSNRGMHFVWMTFSTFVLTLMSVVWLGQIYTASDDPRDGYIFFAAVGLAISNFAFFLWRSRNYVD